MEINCKKIYFASDAHLGARFHKDPLAVEKKLVRWLDSIKQDAASVWLLGDVFDYWYEYKYVVPRGFVRFLGKLAELSDLGIEIHIFIGNHDVWMFDYLPKEIGAIIHHDVLTIDLLGKRFFLGHGDEIDYRSKAFRFMRLLFRNKFCQWLYAGIHPRWTFGFALGWSLSSRKSGIQKEEEMEYQGEAYEYLVDFSKNYLKDHPDINYFIFGHRHIMLDLMLSRTSRLIVAGDWMKLFSYVEWDGETLALKQFEEE
ncbi:UDP-2,3-diacylglucosamine hydrolase [Parabacteroides sp. PF5-5]|uniref:UDP-2,3-diacylglucosamine diphosphatase n=1 Tax=unclassified Parabacteroides TaxID=2649774 RepID=UPI002473AA26|nr:MULTISPECIES: UDP-2,3-diacylglucosamine diphosphatase [unclassified Parabacteroides]MDH6305046.1 UDP-2,3-diacylglucosamine hydrolase [Parabacteroides sp. PH5-39]MDH6315869.1 UDP-2,3-diacylglucosamine hydrolase [Parabacteroides sp. PF5-13]MDH6319526.1 UDP-2,3-diacylglucosamine hydrolase [Parabacteroides sp. PH5-13]MDH6323257.1 UDP-2,3-diacylglucosamine hydrolase [Parabacteroides sp. PH5-8]MDH6327235.1 UDP-2,3-diacylglucosamine hydrolase [Parabacteroides sp. PH5-41]